MNARGNNGLVHLVLDEPRYHQANEDHCTRVGLTECMNSFTWLTRPAWRVSDLRMVPTPDAPTCLRCLWEAACG